MTEERDPFAEPWDDEETDSLGRPITGGAMIIAPAPRRPTPPVPPPPAERQASLWGVVSAIGVLIALGFLGYLVIQQLAR